MSRYFLFLGLIALSLHSASSLAQSLDQEFNRQEDIKNQKRAYCRSAIKQMTYEGKKVEGGIVYEFVVDYDNIICEWRYLAALGQEFTEEVGGKTVQTLYKVGDDSRLCSYSKYPDGAVTRVCREPGTFSLLTSF